jgi:uncharacterized protein (DUF2141 family)
VGAWTWMGDPLVPSEGVGFSNDAFADAGVPSLSRVEFEFMGEQRLRMHLR